MSLLGSLTNHVTSHLTNRKWVNTVLFLARQSHQSCIIPWPTGSEWHCFIYLSGSSSIMSHPMTNRQWVTLLCFFARQSHQSCLIPWPTESEWHCFISLPGSLINHVWFHCDQQGVSDTALLLCQVAVSLIMSHPIMMANRKWVMLLHFFSRHSHQAHLLP